MGKKLKCNEDLVVDLMNYSPFGPLGQVFVVEAIRKYAEALVKNPLPDSPGAMFNPSVWNAIAIDVKGRMDAFYNKGA